MNIEELREYCLSKKGVTESFPFDEVTLVFKVLNKMFALTSLDGELRISLKCEPEIAIELREHYPCVIPAWHMSKIHWNTVIIDGSVNDGLLKEWIDDSYDIVVSKLTKKQREELSLIL
ncbi:MAG: MmcQ/YjbR family DNA-binding protein [Saprospiraceae bacterium]|nr:MmcQ/YjbR family DNA-binding protein [Saprospiraceae bacterium]